MGQVGFEPTTLRLKGECSAVELLTQTSNRTHYTVKNYTMQPGFDLNAQNHRQHGYTLWAGLHDIHVNLPNVRGLLCLELQR